MSDDFPETRDAAESDPPKRVDRITAIVHVWLWSIVFGTGSGVGFTYFGLASRPRFGAFGIAYGILVGFGVIFVWSCWANLYFYFVGHLLPLYFPERRHLRRKNPGLYLRIAISSLFAAGMIRIFIAIVDAILGSF